MDVEERLWIYVPGSINNTDVTRLINDKQPAVTGIRYTYRPVKPLGKGNQRSPFLDILTTG